MKRSFITTILGICMFFAFSQNGHNPPGNIFRSFQKEYPQSQPSQWSHSNDGSWSATFEDKDHNNGEAIANFDQKGRHVDTHIPYDNQDVPQPVRDHVKNNYTGTDNNDYTRIDRPGEQSVYMTRVKHSNKSRTIYTDNAGHERNYTDRHH